MCGRWLQFHSGANTTHLTLPSKYLGEGVSLMSELFEKCQLSKRKLLKGSSHADIKKLYSLTSDKRISSKEIIEGCKYFQDTRGKKKESVLNNFMELKEQNILIKSIVDTCTSSAISQWQKTTNLATKYFLLLQKISYIISYYKRRWRKLLLKIVACAV